MRTKKFYIGATDVSTGEIAYLEPNKNNLEQMLKASSSIPIFYRDFVNIEGVYYTDGGLADPIPAQEAYRRNATNIMVIRSRPYCYNLKANPVTNALSKVFLRKYPHLVKTIINRTEVYKQSVEFIRRPPQGTNILEVNPPDEFSTDRLTKDVSILKKGLSVRI